MQVRGPRPLLLLCRQRVPELLTLRDAVSEGARRQTPRLFDPLPASLLTCKTMYKGQRVRTPCRYSNVLERHQRPRGGTVGGCSLAVEFVGWLGCAAQPRRVTS